MYESGQMARTGRPPEEDRTKVRENVIPGFRVTAEEEVVLREGAARDGQTLGVWLRELGLKRARRTLKK